jgi:hypothetical protein
MTVIDVTQRLDATILENLAETSALTMQPILDSLIKQLGLTFVPTAKVTAKIKVSYNTEANVIHNNISYGIDYGNKNDYTIDPFALAQQLILNEGFARILESSNAKLRA